MKITDITPGTLYKIDERFSVGHIGTAVLAEAWTYTKDRRYSHDHNSVRDIETLVPSPTGRSYGSLAGHSHIRTEIRGVPTITTSPYGDDLDERLAVLPAVLTAAAAHLRSNPQGKPTLPPGYTFVLARPQSYVTTWEQHLIDEAADRAARERQQRSHDEQRNRNAAAKARITAALGSDTKLPYDYMISDFGWEQLEQLLDAYVAAKAAS